MSRKKYFTLIYKDTLHTAPQGKVIPAQEYAKMLSAEELLAHVQGEAERYRSDVVKECEALKMQAQKEGFEAGFAAWAKQIAMLEKEISEVNKATEKIIIPVALKAAKKILGREVELNHEAVVDIVANKLKSVAQHKQITIYVNKEDLLKLETGKDKLKKLFENLETFSVKPREGLATGSCVIETEAGIINAEIESQWHIIEQAFQVLGKK